MADQLKRYAFINAKLKTRLGSLLPEEFFNRLIHARTLNEAVQLLHDTPFRAVESVYAATGDLKMGELELFSHEIELHREIGKLVADDLLIFLNALIVRFEIENLKQTLRLWLDRNVRKRDISSATGYLYRGVILHEIDWDALINAADTEELVRLLEGTPYAAVLKASGAAIMESHSLFAAETELDRLFYDGIREAARGLNTADEEIVSRIVGVEIDMENLSRIFRFRRFYEIPTEQILAAVIPGGYRIGGGTLAGGLTGGGDGEMLHELINGSYPEFSHLSANSGGDAASRLQLIEELLTEIQRREIQRLLLGNPFTVGIMLAYFFRKHREVNRLSTILNAKYYGLDEDSVRRRI